MRSRLSLAALLVGVVLLSAGCVRLPESGPVVETNARGRTETLPANYYKPPKPPKGASAAAIVQGFLDAMTATPIQPTAAREYLSRDSRQTWNPRGYITYEDAGPPRGTAVVSVSLTGASRIDARGTWRGRVPSRQPMQFRMAFEDHEWRIADPPDSLVVPETWFEQRFEQLSVYYFDPSAKILVPEPVYVPTGDQLATALVDALLQGPAPGLGDVSRTFFPSGLTRGLSVPVSARGVADITLKGQPGQQNPQAVALLVAQLAWTLKQDPAITAFRVSIDDRPLALPDATTVFGVDEGAQYDPTYARSSSLLYALSDGRLVSGAADSLTGVEGPFGTGRYGLRSMAVSLNGEKLAGVPAGGTTVLLGPAQASQAPVRTVVSSAHDLLQPAWDFAGRIWLVDRTPGGARVLYYQNGRTHLVTVPGISGTDVKRFLVSRDGSRIVALVRGRHADRLMSSRIGYSSDGRADRGTRAIRIAWDGGGEPRIRDIGWHSPTTISVLHLLTQDLSQVRTVSVDGSPIGTDAEITTLTGRARSLVTSPVVSEPTFIIIGQNLFQLSGSDPGEAVPGSPVAAVGYAG